MTRTALQPIVSLKHICREYVMGDQLVHALKDVSLDIQTGEVITLTGASGSGKSTLLNVIGCLDRPTSGSYRIEGTEVTTLAEPARVELRRFTIGFIFQTFHLVPRMTALANVELPMIFASIDPKQRRQRAVQTLEAVGLGPRMHHRPDQLSGGERQRVAIARALVMGPSILLADEPTGNLDTASGREIMRLLLQLNQRGHTLIIVTHSPEVAAVGHRSFVMRDGSMV